MKSSINSFFCHSFFRAALAVSVFFALLFGFLPPFSIDSAYAADNTYEVDTTNWTADANAGDGICADASADCSLKAAIQEANATAGSDEITFAAALYGGGAATITFGESIHITDADVTITGPGSGNIVLNLGGGATLIVDNTASGVTITGLSVTNAGAGNSCLSVQGADNATISNNIVSSCGLEGIDVQLGSYSVETVTISGNTISEYETGGTGNGNAIDIWGANAVSDATVSNNTITGVDETTAVMISCWSDAGSNITVSGNGITGGEYQVYVQNASTVEISDNTLNSATDSAIYFEEGASLTVKQNTIDGAVLGIRVTDAETSVVVGGSNVSDANTLTNIDGTAGVYMESTSSASIQNNSITTTGTDGTYGVLFSECTSCTLSDNTIVQGATDGGGYFAYSGSGNTISDNTITLGSSVTQFGIASLDSSTSITDNTITGGGTSNGGGINLASDGSSVTVTGNAVSSVAVGYQIGVSGFMGGTSYTVGTTNTMESVATGFSLVEDGTTGNTFDTLTIPDGATTHVSSDAGSGSINYFDNVNVESSKITVTSGTVDVNYDARGYAATSDSSVVSGATVEAVTSSGVHTSLGTTAGTGYTSYTSLDAYQVDSTGVINNQGSYTFSALSSQGNAFVTQLIDTQNELVSLTVAASGWSPACDDGEDNDGDGLVDYPYDPGCVDRDDDDESEALVEENSDGEVDGQEEEVSEDVVGEEEAGGDDGEEEDGLDSLDEILDGLDLDFDSDSSVSASVFGHWAEDYILDINERGVIPDISDDYDPDALLVGEGLMNILSNLFSTISVYIVPDQYVTRAELLAVLFNSAGVDVSGASDYGFSDAAGHVYLDYINFAALNGIVNGYGDGTFGPDDYVTNAQVAKIVFLMIDMGIVE